MLHLMLFPTSPPPPSATFPTYACTHLYVWSHVPIVERPKSLKVLQYMTPVGNICVCVTLGAEA